jgi:predicted ATP-dependent protease
VISRDDVQAALDAREYRSDRTRARHLEYIERGIILIDTAGQAVAQVNGLAVAQLDDFAFGHPVRITATTRLGEGEVVDIEREIEMGGPIHSKGVMILSSFLMARYAKHHPISVSASLVFEQSYSGIEGDSASLAELAALLSSLSNVPVKQSMAITGSVNQHGQAQPIGGVNEKIEGFFDVCSRRGLDGSHGVIIPLANVDDLMLRADVVEAVEQEKFCVHAVSSADEAIELLTGIDAGRADDNGEFPHDSVNGRVDAALVALAELRREHAHPSESQSGEETPEPDGTS